MTEQRPSPNDFRASMPESYRKNFDAAASEAHARISAERGTSLASVGTFPSSRVGTALCVVAEDRPGLLATISAALVLCRLDVIEAEAYTRRRDGQQGEAVDVFWVRADPGARPNDKVSAEDIANFGRTLLGLIEGKVDKSVLGAPLPARTPGAAETVVRFIEDREGSFSTLEVETGDRSGLLLSLAQALFNQRVQIISSQVKTNGSRVFDRFSIVEIDGSPISQRRRLEIQVAVLSAVDPVALQATSEN